MTSTEGGSALVAMSGGIDSSAAAILLQDEGLRLIGVTMKLFGYSALARPELVSGCCSLEDAEDAKLVCRKLGFPHYTFNFVEQFDACVMQPFCSGYARGETPNPCVDCNRHLKFGGLHRRRRELGLDRVATGHYARIVFDGASGLWQLHRAACAAKDQSYLLYHLDQDQLAHTLFPLGNMTKDQARNIVAARGFGIASKQESQDICFAPDGDYLAFIEHHDGESPLHPGAIVDLSGKRVGTHDGLARYTIGQRKGIGIAAAEPLYVIAKDATANTLVVGPAAELLTRQVRARDLSFISGSLPHGAIRVQAKTSYRQEPQPATAEVDGAGELTVVFDEPQRKAACGQALVLYDADLVLGGGTIF